MLFCVRKGRSIRYLGRVFEEGDYYDCIRRNVFMVSRNRSWLYTADLVIEKETGKKLIQVVRWRARGTRLSHDRSWRRRRSFNVRSERQWIETKRVIDYLVPTLEMGQEESVDWTSGQEEDFSDSQQVEDLKAEVTRSAAMARHHKDRASRLSRLLNDIRANRRHYRMILDDFDSLIRRPGITEREIHVFIENEKAYWMFGLEYIDMESRVRFPPDTGEFEFDLMLKRADDFYDLVELKGPGERLFDARTSKRAKPNRALSEALGQVIVYLHACSRSDLRTVLKPKAIVVLGTAESDDIGQRRLLQSHIAGVEILTYHDLSSRGRALIDYIGKRKRKATKESRRSGTKKS